MLRKGQFLQVIKDVVMRLQYKGRQQKLESAAQDAFYVVLSLIQKAKAPKLKRQPSTVQYARSVVHKEDSNRKTTCFEHFHQIPNLLDLQEHSNFLTSKTSSSKKRQTTDKEDY